MVKLRSRETRWRDRKDERKRDGVTDRYKKRVIHTSRPRDIETDEQR